MWLFYSEFLPMVMSINGKFMLTGVFRFYQRFFFSPVKVLCNRPQI